MPRRLVIAVLVALFVSAGCDVFRNATVFGKPSVQCGAFEGPDCNDLLELGLDALSGGRTDEPVAIAVDNACPPNARCAASELGGNTAGVAVRWSDGTVRWATIPLPADWPARPPGDASAMTDPVPAHLAVLVGPG